MKFERELHVGYFTDALTTGLPSAYSGLDTNRLTLVHFCVQALDLLGALDNNRLLDKRSIVEWIYSLQHLPTEHQDQNMKGTRTVAKHGAEASNDDEDDFGGFKGGTFLGPAYLTSTTTAATIFPGQRYDHSHVAMSYTALCTLAALGDDLCRVDRKGLVRSLRPLQRPDGSFSSTTSNIGAEHDMRFLYCACALSHMLGDWNGVDADAAVRYVKSCRSFDGAIGLLPWGEGHGGSTYCAVASLALMGRMDDVLGFGFGSWRDELIRWCVHRQTTPADEDDYGFGGDSDAVFRNGGMQGRPNKNDDTCYSFWIGGTLRLLGGSQLDGLLDIAALRRFVLMCQSPMGGFGKMLGVPPDLMHSFYSLAWLSMAEDAVEDREREEVSACCGGTGGEARNENTNLVRKEKELEEEKRAASLRRLECTLGICRERLNSFHVFH